MYMANMNISDQDSDDFFKVSMTIIMKQGISSIFDLSNVPIGERVTLQAMTTATVPLSMTGQLPFFVNKRTELLTSWLLFPENLPYSTYKLVRYPVDKSTPPIPMDPRFAIDHPFGSLIGWSVITPKEGMVYECRWTNQ